MSFQWGMIDAIFVVQEIWGLRLSLDIRSPVAMMLKSWTELRGGCHT
jgi:hypothetical protein